MGYVATLYSKLVGTHPVAEPAPEGAEEAVGSVPEAVDEANVGGGQVERPDNLTP